MPRLNRYRVAPQQEAPRANAPQRTERPAPFRDQGLFRGHRVAPSGQEAVASVSLRDRLAFWSNTLSAKIATGFQKVSEMINRGGELRRVQEAQEQAAAARLVEFIVASRIAMQERYEIQCEMHRPAPSYEEITAEPPSYSEVMVEPLGAPPSYEETLR